MRASALLNLRLSRDHESGVSSAPWLRGRSSASPEYWIARFRGRCQLWARLRGLAACIARVLINNVRPSKKKRAWGMPGAWRTRSLVCARSSKNAHEYSQRGRQNHPASPRNGLRLMASSPRRSGSFASVACGMSSHADLTPASRRQDHTSLPSASVPFVIGTSASTASRPAFVTIASRPFRWDETAANTQLIWLACEEQIFLRRGLDR